MKTLNREQVIQELIWNQTERLNQLIKDELFNDVKMLLRGGLKCLDDETNYNLSLRYLLTFEEEIIVTGEEPNVQQIKILSEGNTQTLQKSLQHHLDNGWILVGDMNVVHTHLQNRYSGDKLMTSTQQSEYSVLIKKL
jgi:hypothetical protein